MIVVLDVIQFFVVIGIGDFIGAGTGADSHVRKQGICTS